MRRLGICAAALAFLTSAALAQAPDRSPRPLPRPAMIVAEAALAMPRPKRRPAVMADGVTTALRLDAPDAATPFSEPLLHPRARPNPAQAEIAPAPVQPVRRGWSLFRRAAAVRTQPGAESVQPRKGAVCGDPAILGETMAPIVSRVAGCGVAEPVRITSVAGVGLSQAPTVDCATARALKTWVERGLQPAFRRNHVVKLQVAAHYICRTRNNRPGAKVSEHGRGKAIDISGFTLADGSTLQIRQDWRGRYGAAIKSAHKAACGIFGTTLGPGSDGYHEDHLHFDTATYRYGAYCH